MRPIDRGPIPLLANGAPKTVRHYADWRSDLISRIGYYCAFCNMRLSENMQVEHVIAQNLNPALLPNPTRILDWDNMLLACGACNRTKSNQPCPPDTHYLPQYHNTHLAFTTTGIVKRSPRRKDHAIYITHRTGNGASPVKAQNTIGLCALNRDTTNSAARATDLRWKFRYDALIAAKQWRIEWDDWGHSRPANFITLLLTAALPTGFWSIWFDAFADVQPVREALVQQFPGTATGCFDAAFNPQPRNPRNPSDAI